jgi:hypothetical protein
VHVDVRGTISEIIAFIRTMVGNRRICITRTAALMSRFESGIGLTFEEEPPRIPHILTILAGLSHCGSAAQHLDILVCASYKRKYSRLE